MRAHRLWVAIAVVVVLVVGGGIAVRVWLTTDPRAVTVGETVDRYRETSTEKAPGASLRAPDAGVYVYDTSGFESVDALGGDRHDYPAETAMTVVAEGCGFRVTWTPLEERTDSSLVCQQGDGLVVVESTTAHAFFRQSDEEHFVCDEGAWWLPPPGVAAWTTVCRTPDRVSTRSALVVGTEVVSVGGHAVDAVHLRFDDVLSSGSTGTTTSDVWLDRATGLVLKQHNDAETKNDSVLGVVVFKEEIDLTLRALDPQR